MQNGGTIVVKFRFLFNNQKDLWNEVKWFVMICHDIKL